MEGYGRSRKVKEGHGWSFPITRLTFQVRKVPFLFLWTIDLGFGIWIWDLDWDLDLRLGFGTGLGLDNNSKLTLSCQPNPEHSTLLNEVAIFSLNLF